MLGSSLVVSPIERVAGWPAAECANDPADCERLLNCQGGECTAIALGIGAARPPVRQNQLSRKVLSARQIRGVDKPGCEEAYGRRASKRQIDALSRENYLEVRHCLICCLTLELSGHINREAIDWSA